MSQGTWTDEVNNRIQTILAQIESVRGLGSGLELTDAEMKDLLSPYTEILESLYTEDLQLAKILDNSDFVVGAEGEGIGHGEASVSVMIKLLSEARDQTVKVAKAILNATGKDLTLKLQPNFYGYAPGSIYLGFSAPKPPPEQIFAEQDSLYLAVKNALHILGVVSVLVADNADLEQISEAVPDPSARDAALNALYAFTPSKRLGIDKVTVGVKSLEKNQNEVYRSAALTNELRKKLKSIIDKPTRSKERGDFRGIMREIDLDIGRFELRSVEGFDETISIRCVYPKYLEDKAKRLLDRTVRVSGLIEKDLEGRPRLLTIDEFIDGENIQNALGL
jgi:hypothetical protein